MSVWEREIKLIYVHLRNLLLGAEESVQCRMFFDCDDISAANFEKLLLLNCAAGPSCDGTGSQINCNTRIGNVVRTMLSNI